MGLWRGDSTNNRRALGQQRPRCRPKDFRSSLIGRTEGPNPAFRRVHRDGKWKKVCASLDVADSDLDPDYSFAMDAERIVVAIGRAWMRLNRPVMESDVHEEVDADPALELVSRQRARIHLNAIRLTAKQSWTAREPWCNFECPDRRVFGTTSNALWARLSDRSIPGHIR